MAGSLLHHALIFLGAALVFVPLAKKAGIGSVLGYLIGGMVIGPFILGLVGHEGEDIMHASEFGVVMMLFVIGLELHPATFWKMKNQILGMGGAQMIFTSFLLFPFLFWIFKLDWSASIALSMAFAMSSTAIILQTLKEKALEGTEAGRSSFAVLLFQDIAVIPVLALLPLLVTSQNIPTEGKHQSSAPGIFADYPSLAILAAVIFVFFSSRYLIRPILRLVAKIHMRELFTAAALFIVIGVATLMEWAGISAALGAFMAGILLANSEYRHELESDIEPFKGVLLGLFFTAVGSTIDFALIGNELARLILAVFAIMLIKSLALFITGKLFRFNIHQNILFILLLSQVGEFAFVLLGSAGQLGITNQETNDFFVAVVTVTMILSPVLLFLHEKWMRRYSAPVVTPEILPDQIDHQHEVILVGFGHFGSTVGRFLRANGVQATILDNDIDQVLFLRKMGFTVYYGDATRLDLLRSAGAERARVLVSAIQSLDINRQLAEMIKKHFPGLTFFSRVKNRMDAYEMIEEGTTRVYRDSLHTSVNLGVDILHFLGYRKYTVHRKAQEFIRYDEEALQKLAAERHNMDQYIHSAREEIEQQEKLLFADKKFSEQKHDNAWDKTGLT